MTSLDGIFGDGKRTQTTVITRPNTAETQRISIPGIPVGDLSVRVAAYGADGAEVATAPAEVVRIQPGQPYSFYASLRDTAPFPNLVAFDVVEDSVRVNTPMTVRVRMSSIAPADGVSIFLRSSNTYIYFSSSVVFVPEGETEVTVPVTVLRSNASGSNPLPQTVTVTAFYNVVGNLSDTVTVTP